MELLGKAARGSAPSLVHCRRMFDHHGMVQFASGTKPDLTYGYCLDDNARAFLAAIITLSPDQENADAKAIGSSALDFIKACRRPDGRFHNLMAADGSFTDEIGSQDSFGRLMWACGVTACCAPIAQWRLSAQNLLEVALQHSNDLLDLHPVAYAALGLAAALAPDSAAPTPPHGPPLPEALATQVKALLQHLCARLAGEFETGAESGWEWFEPVLTWGNARLPEALLRGAAALRDDRFAEAGMRSFEFLASVTQDKDRFVPIGNRGWYRQDGVRAIYDQQPIEACAMVDAWLAAARLTDQLEYESKALEAFSWFLGLNTQRLALVDENTGGCYDGLEDGYVNLNMGAESTLSYVHAHAALAAHFTAKKFRESQSKEIS